MNRRVSSSRAREANDVPIGRDDGSIGVKAVQASPQSVRDYARAFISVRFV
jgi:hypothetical protein